MTHRALRQAQYHHPVLVAESIRVTYPGGRRALDGVSCALAPGAITVLVGPNGAGKSTLLRVLAAVRAPDAGSVTLDGRPIRSFKPRERARRVALVAQQPTLAFDFDARRVIAFGAQGAGRAPACVERAVDRFDLGGLASVPFGALSVGQRQRVSLARAWAQLDAQPGATFLGDEPVSAMDPAMALHALTALRELADRSVAVCLVLHDLSAAARVADHAVLLDHAGRLAHAGAAHAVLTQGPLTALFGTPITRSDAPGIGAVLGATPPGGADPQSQAAPG